MIQIKKLNTNQSRKFYCLPNDVTYQANNKNKYPRTQRRKILTVKSSTIQNVHSASAKRKKGGYTLQTLHSIRLVG